MTRYLSKMDRLRDLIVMMLERAIKEEDIEEMSGASAAGGYTVPLGVTPSRVKNPRVKKGKRKTKR